MWNVIQNLHFITYDKIVPCKTIPLRFGNVCNCFCISLCQIDKAFESSNFTMADVIHVIFVKFGLVEVGRGWSRLVEVGRGWSRLVKVGSGVFKDGQS